MISGAAWVVVAAMSSHVGGSSEHTTFTIEPLSVYTCNKRLNIAFGPSIGVNRFWSQVLGKCSVW